MTEGTEVVDGELDDRRLVDHHAGRTARLAVDLDHRHRGGREVGDRGERHEAVDLAAERGQRPLLLCGLGARVGDEHGEVATPRLGLHSPEDRAEVGVRDVGNEDADGAGPPAHEVAGRTVRDEAHGLDGGEDLGPRGRCDHRRAAERPGHRCGVNPGAARDVVQRRGSAGLRHGGDSSSGCKRLHTARRNHQTASMGTERNPADHLRPRRPIRGCAAVLLPHDADGEVDWRRSRPCSTAPSTRA